MKRFTVEAFGNTSVTDGASVRFILTAGSAEEAIAAVRQQDSDGVYERLEVVSEEDLTQDVTALPGVVVPATGNAMMGAKGPTKKDGAA